MTPSSSHRVGLCSEKDVEMILNLLKEESRMIISLIKKLGFFGYFYGKPGSKSLKVLLCRHFIENMEIIVYNPCPVRVLLSSILNYHKRDARAKTRKLKFFPCSQLRVPCSLLSISRFSITSTEEPD